jgi:ribosome-binding protein aMBF1 (putative translation factor)
MKNIKQKFFSAEELHKKWMKNPEYRREYDALEPEFQIAEQIIKARIERKISQEELAKRMNTGQAVVSRLEGMNGSPSLSLLKRLARALDIKLQLTIQ